MNDLESTVLSSFAASVSFGSFFKEVVEEEKGGGDSEQKHRRGSTNPGSNFKPISANKMIL